MNFVWRDYDPETMSYVETWLDESAVRSTGLDDGFRDFYEYWANEDGFVVGENFWCKVVCETDDPVAVIALCQHEQTTSIMEIVVDPGKRGRGIGTKLLRELLTNNEIIGFSIHKSEAVIFPSNIASKKAFENAGFQYHHMDKDEDGTSISYIYEKETDVITHYDMLIDENNDPFYDPPALREYMNGWDGKVFLDSLNLSGNQSVLEIGVGTGRIAVQVAPHCMRLTGIDISPKTIKRAKENLKNHSNISYICDDFLKHDFQETFDVVYSSLTMMHFQNKEQVISKVAELLNDNGIFCLSIDKNQNEYIDMGTRRVKIYPDTLDNITELIGASVMTVVNVWETDNAHIIVSKKPMQRDGLNVNHPICPSGG